MRQGRRARSIDGPQPRRVALRWVVGGVGVVVAVVSILVTVPSGGDDGATATGRASIGAAAPEVEMVDFDGASVSLADYRGTPVVVNFWASWCPFCIAEMPDFERVHQRVGDRVAFLGVDLQDDRSQAVRLAEETGVSYRLAADPDGVVYAAFGGSAMPTTVFIDADGIVREVVGGQMSASQLEASIQRHFGVTL